MSSGPQEFFFFAVTQLELFLRLFQQQKNMLRVLCVNLEVCPQVVIGNCVFKLTTLKSHVDQPWLKFSLWNFVDLRKTYPRTIVEISRLILFVLFWTFIFFDDFEWDNPWPIPAGGSLVWSNAHSIIYTILNANCLMNLKSNHYSRLWKENLLSKWRWATSNSLRMLQM